MKIIDSDNNLSREFIASLILTTALIGLVFGYLGARLYQSSHSSQPAQISAQQESDQVSLLVKQVSPAVVSIIASQDLPVIERQFRNPFFEFCDDPFFKQFFNDCDDQPAPRQQRIQISAGTGFIVKSDGLIITNKHVVDISDAEYTVILNNDQKYPAKVMAKDPVHDIALIKIQAFGLPTLALGDSNNLAVGQTVVAIGNALGQFSNTVSKGIVSGLARSVTAQSGGTSEQLEKVIQTDAAINPGNSGGPLLDLSGKVIGINIAIVSGAQNVGFAIPVSRVKKDLEDVEVKGKIYYPFLGVRYIVIDTEIKDQYNTSADYGALVISSENQPAIVPDSPAAKAGIREGDIILEADEKRIDSSTSLSEIVQFKKPGDTISLKIKRGEAIFIQKIILNEK